MLDRIIQASALTPNEKMMVRDIREGHLTIWHDPNGEDLPDRSLRGGMKAWVPLVEKGYLELRPGARFWTLTNKAQD